MFRTVDFPVYRQLDQMDCGPSCLKMLTEFFGKKYDLEYLRQISFLQRDGASLGALAHALQLLGIESVGIKANLQELIAEVPLPAIAHWEGNHFVVIYRTNRKFIFVSDPAYGRVKYRHKEFVQKWTETESRQGILLLTEPTQQFFNGEPPEPGNKGGLWFLLDYLRPHKKYINQVLLGLFIAATIQIMLPFLTQSLVDYGINYEDFSFINLILIAQLFLFITRSASEVIRDWILLYISTRVNIQMLSDFLEKLLGLPIAYFESKTTGDFMQRIYDHQRIDEFLTGRGLSIPFDILSILVFGLVLSYFSSSITSIFVLGTILFFSWSLLFMKKKEVLDNQLFDLNRKDQSLFLQIILAVSEIKLNNSEKRRKGEWESNQKDLFRLKSRILRVGQTQIKGRRFITEFTSILIIFWSAKEVITGEITLGTMLAIQFIIGSLTLPVSNMVDFLSDYQSAMLSFNRLSEVHNQTPEENFRKYDETFTTGDIQLKDLVFKYGEPSIAPVLKNINITIPQGKVTAIVGASGSGKTTSLKLLLKFYKPTKGFIKVEEEHFEDISTALWRSKCGTVMQDGCLFNDTLERNITESQPDTPVNHKMLRRAVGIVNLADLVENSPLGFQTKIGENGQLLSGGEKQRVLLARAIYKNPDYLFLDEATSSLDSENERLITEDLTSFWKNRTVVIIAHRLSTVINADQILVMEKGEIVERGSHQELLSNKGAYHKLIKNQLTI
ncbi:peptidase domain-containing ABC transporter [Autumnicola musiva]|uniref:Peptidase domain-containing ABC transporter n=1 Tax=Autumnicola musiva TaxID=3075589 RepID=A0ABU3DA18_9FLAO|nr:peptidase domain-containing ABC transporter [Zunongwangia sp. F117]MDT0677793.1 peptidase domain-containing ABC transporter [Zunongwangia sp. F117]